MLYIIQYYIKVYKNTMDFKTKRLRLIPIQLEHLQVVYTYYEPSIHEFLSPPLPKSIEDTKAVIEHMIDQRMAKTDFVFAILNIETKEFLGLCGLHDLKTKNPHIGIWLKQTAHHNKYGQEAVGALICYAKQLGLKEIYYAVDCRNLASIKIINLYHGVLIEAKKIQKTSDGRTLFMNNYIIYLK